MELPDKSKEEREVFTLRALASEFAPLEPMEFPDKSKEEREVFTDRAPVAHFVEHRAPCGRP